MAKSTKEEINPIGVLVVILAGLIAFGAGQAGGDGGGNGGSDSNGQAAAWDPCPKGTSFSHEVASWTVGGKELKLLCGSDKRIGWRKLAKKHHADRHTLGCIARVLRNSGPPIPKGANDEYVIRFANSKGGNALAKVGVERSTGLVVSAYVRRGTWADCIARR